MQLNFGAEKEKRFCAAPANFYTRRTWQVHNVFTLTSKTYIELFGVVIGKKIMSATNFSQYLGIILHTMDFLVPAKCVTNRFNYFFFHAFWKDNCIGILKPLYCFVLEVAKPLMPFFRH